MYIHNKSFVFCLDKYTYIHIYVLNLSKTRLFLSIVEFKRSNLIKINTHLRI